MFPFPPHELRQAALSLLIEDTPVKKSAGVRQLARVWGNNQMSLACNMLFEGVQPVPGQPELPLLVSPRHVPQRKLNTPEGRAAMVHALVHIEFNAINLALDAIWRFQNMPQAYYTDWLRVADEEALHFDLLAAHLRRLGYVYGDFPAHNGLWDLALATSQDVLARMALLPRTMEARGLDVTPGLRAKLVQAGDDEIGPILDLILRDEIGHVAIGNHWFNWLCAQRHLEPIATYDALATAHRAPVMRGPFNVEARRRAGFSEQELQVLTGVTS